MLLNIERIKNKIFNDIKDLRCCDKINNLKKKRFMIVLILSLY